MATPKTVATSKAIRSFLASIGRKGGLKTSKALSTAQRQEIARKAAQVRWERYRQAKKSKRPNLEHIAEG